MAGREKNAGRLYESSYRQYRSRAKFFRGAKYFDLKRATVFCSGHCLFKRKMTRYARSYGGQSVASLSPYLPQWLQEKRKKKE